MTWGKHLETLHSIGACSFVLLEVGPDLYLKGDVCQIEIGLDFVVEWMVICLGRAKMMH